MPLRRAGSARDLHATAATTQGRECSPLPPKAAFPSPARSLRHRERPPWSASARISRPCSVAAVAFRPLALPRPCSVAAVAFRPLALPRPAPWQPSRFVRSHFPALLRGMGRGVLCSTWNSLHLLSATLQLLSTTLHLLSTTLHLLSAVGF